MNNYFEIRRFGYLLKKVASEKKWLVLGLYVLIAIYIFFVYSGRDGHTTSMMLQHLSLLVGVIFSPTILIGVILNYFSSKKSTINYLSLPVSFFERWLLVVVITFFIFLPVVIGTTIAIDYYYVGKFREIALNELKIPTAIVNHELKYLSFDFHNQAFHLGLYLRSVLIVTGLTLLGSLFFTKFSFVKIVIFTFVLFFGYMTFQRFLLGIVIEKGTIGNISDLARAAIPSKVSSQPFVVYAEEGVRRLVKVFMDFVMPAAIWAIALLRFKEKEI